MDKDNVATLERAEAEQDVESLKPAIGEVVLSGVQVDTMTSHLDSLELTTRVFVQYYYYDEKAGPGKESHFYRTGDLGYIEPENGVPPRVGTYQRWWHGQN